MPAKWIYIIAASLTTSLGTVCLQTASTSQWYLLRHTHENLTSPFFIAFSSWALWLAPSGFATDDEDLPWRGDTCGELATSTSPDPYSPVVIRTREDDSMLPS
ncbi:uncharacterized protein ARMOST_14987 [Armillaria ostoyae]|uniref:Uncharacterized protein n=1 Tax=Armillaria ostoyae TaxID=47428 RepID=A0A284RS41_ARMOS|nr:uncharacterized protein ARMOST_14987 [Armillaria ostoyae]